MENEGRFIDEPQAASVEGADSVFRAVYTRVQVLVHLGQISRSPENRVKLTELRLLGVWKILLHAIQYTPACF